LLTHKQSAFIEAYKLLNDPVKSAISAGYAAKSAHVEASRLMKSAKILHEIDLWRKSRKEEITKHDFIDMAIGDYRQLDIAEPNKPRFLDIAGKALGYLGVNGQEKSQTINNLTQININGSENQSELWELTRKLLGND
jgi:hypothetical protein